MISLIDLNKSIVDLLRGSLIGTQFENVTISPSDLSEISRPSLKIELDGIKLENINANYKVRALTVRVYFFASDLNKYKIENLYMQEIIEGAFIKGIWINDYFTPVNEINAVVSDTVLQIDFDITITSFTNDETGEFMEDLDFEMQY